MDHIIYRCPQRKKEKIVWDKKGNIYFFGQMSIIRSSSYPAELNQLRQLSAYNKIRNYGIKTSFVSPEGLKARANKIGINFMVFIVTFLENCM